MRVDCRNALISLIRHELCHGECISSRIKIAEPINDAVVALCLKRIVEIELQEVGERIPPEDDTVDFYQQLDPHISVFDMHALVPENDLQLLHVKLDVGNQDHLVKESYGHGFFDNVGLAEGDPLQLAEDLGLDLLGMDRSSCVAKFLWMITLRLNFTVFTISCVSNMTEPIIHRPSRIYKGLNEKIPLEDE